MRRGQRFTVALLRVEHGAPMLEVLKRVLHLARQAGSARRGRRKLNLGILPFKTLLLTGERHAVSAIRQLRRLTVKPKEILSKFLID